jgi:hypothetical protein
LTLHLIPSEKIHKVFNGLWEEAKSLHLSQGQHLLIDNFFKYVNTQWIFYPVLTT